MSERRYSEQEVGAIFELATKAQAGSPRQLPKGSDTTRRILGMPIGVGRTVNLGRKLSDAEWEHLVVKIREMFDATGRVKQEGAFRQWSNGNLQVLLEPTPTGHQLRMRTVRSRSLGLMVGGFGAFVVAAAMLVTTAMASGADPARAASAAVFMGATGLGLFAWGALVLPGWSRLRRRQMEEIAELLTAPRE